MLARSVVRPTVRWSLRFTVALLLLGLSYIAAPVRLEAQSNVRVLVAPLTTGAGVDRKFGEKVAEEVRKRLDDLDATKPLKKDDVNDALRRFGLASQTLTPLQWTAIAANLNANLVMVGNADATDSGVQVKTMFIKAKSGDELPIPEITVPDDGGSDAKEASRRIVEAFHVQVASLSFEEHLESPEDYAQRLPGTPPKLKNSGEIRKLIQRLYPTQPREGAVVLMIYIDDQGVVRRSQVQKSSGYDEMDKAAMSVAAKMKFTPAMDRGKRTPVWVAQALTFEVP